MILKDSKQTEASFQEIADCRAINIGASGFAECQCAGPNSCAYALPFGYAFLCQHPRMGEIVARTEREKPAPDQAN
jgi:hypothetical protein